MACVRRKPVPLPPGFCCTCPQVQMAMAGAAKMVAIAVQDPDRAVVTAAVVFATSLFHGGNAVVQDALLAHLETEDTAHAFVHTLVDKVRLAGQSFRYLKSELAVVAPHGSDGVRQHMLQTKADVVEIRGVLRFMQLLCEGHHLRMQNYLRDQGGSSTARNAVLEVMGFLKHPIRCICSGVLEGAAWNCRFFSAKHKAHHTSPLIEGACLLNSFGGWKQGSKRRGFKGGSESSWKVSAYSSEW